MTKKSVLLPLLVVLSCGIGRAADPNAKASEASVKELLDVTHARQMMDNVLAQMDGMMKAQTQQAMQGQTVSPVDQANIDKSQAKSMERIKGEMNWDKLEPVYLQVYEQSFTQSEVDGMVAFYKTPAGQAAVTKTPLVMQNMMSIMQQRMAGVMQEAMAAQSETTPAAPVEKPAEKKKGK